MTVAPLAMRIARSRPSCGLSPRFRSAKHAQGSPFLNNPPGGLAAARCPPRPPRPVIDLTTNFRSPHHAGCEGFSQEGAFVTSFTNTQLIATGARHPRHLNARVSALLLLKYK